LLLCDVGHAAHRTAPGGRVRSAFGQLAVSEEPQQQTPERAA
jgi:hypothetical protein